MIVLMPTVDPWRTCFTSGSLCRFALWKQCRIPSVSSLGVVDDLVWSIRPSSPIATKSVNVPPISTPTRIPGSPPSELLSFKNTTPSFVRRAEPDSTSTRMNRRVTNSAPEFLFLRQRRPLLSQLLQKRIVHDLFRADRCRSLVDIGHHFQKVCH